jgi:predicted DNA-binding transcriptional regulator YafY
MPKKILQRLKRIDNLIKTKAAGKASDLANKLELSESTIYEYLAVMKSFGAPIRYDHDRGTYYYEEEGSFKIYFEKK